MSKSAWRGQTSSHRWKTPFCSFQQVGIVVGKNGLKIRSTNRGRLIPRADIKVDNGHQEMRKEHQQVGIGRIKRQNEWLGGHSKLLFFQSGLCRSVRRFDVSLPSRQAWTAAQHSRDQKKKERVWVSAWLWVFACVRVWVCACGEYVNVYVS